MDEVLSTDEVAAHIKIAAGTLRQWRHRGIGPRSFRVGGRLVKYRRADIEAWLAEQYAAENGAA